MANLEPERPPSLGVRIQKLLSVGLLAVPAAAILSASIYFVFLSSSIGIVPLQFFNLQDHFDKAVDLLIPVFLLVGIANLLAAFAAGVFDEPSASRQRENAIAGFIRSWIIPALFLVFGIVGFLSAPEEQWWLAFQFTLFGILMLSVGLFPDVYRKILTIAKVGWMTLWGMLLLAGGLFAYIEHDVSSSLAAAKKSNFANEKPVLIDNFSFGHLLIEDGRFKVKTSDGALLVEGLPLPRESKSIACKWGWTWACGSTIFYREQEL